MIYIIMYYVCDICIAHGSLRFKNSLKRIYYATPTSFLELIQTFKTLLGGKRKQVTDLKDKYEKGLEPWRECKRLPIASWFGQVWSLGFNEIIEIYWGIVKSKTWIITI